jgi:GDP-6-deoxy-D-talose 4-dehydrogenase
MTRKRILVTGADGFTGRYVTEALAAAGHEVHGLVHRMPAVPVAGAGSVLTADLRDAEGISTAVAAVQPERVVHLAAIAFIAHADIEAMYDTNIIGTRNVLEALSKLASGPEKVLIASSANVYGNSTAGMLTESTPAAPANDYAVTKLSMEHVAGLYAERLPITVVRPFNYTGVGQAESFLLPKIVAHVRRRAPAIELGNLDVARDFSDVRTVVNAYLRLLDEPSAAGGTFNVCSGVAVTLSEVLDLVQRISGHSFQVKVNPAFVRANEVKTLLGDRSRLDACIGTLPRIALHETLRWMVDAA